jgi:quercetin dioxygenase-like cupin family protein
VHGHSEEIVLVLRGQLTAYVGDEEHVLREGDSLHFMSSTPHRGVNAGSEIVHALWIISPPSL